MEGSIQSVTQLWEAGLKGRAQLQPQSQLQTTSSSGLKGCSAVIHLTQRLSHLKKKTYPPRVFSEAFSQTPSRAWLAGLPHPTIKPWSQEGRQPLSVSPPGIPWAPQIAVADLGCPCPESPPVLFCSLAQSTAYRISLPLEFPLPCFFFLFPSKL